LDVREKDARIIPNQFVFREKTYKVGNLGEISIDTTDVMAGRRYICSRGFRRSPSSNQLWQDEARKDDNEESRPQRRNSRRLHDLAERQRQPRQGSDQIKSCRVDAAD
jgi:hypothetical protein